MNIPDIDFTRIRSTGPGGQRDGFEQFICQLVGQEPPSADAQFVSLHGAGGDGGVECFWTFTDGSEHGWQAKFWTSPDDVKKAQLDNSVETALTQHPKLTEYTIAIPVDPTGPTGGNGESLLEKITKSGGWLDGWKAKAAAHGMTVEFELEWKTNILTRLERVDTTGVQRRYVPAAQSIAALCSDDEWWTVVKEQIATPSLNAPANLGTRRDGDLDGAYISTQKAIEYFVEGGPLYSALAADAFSAQARVLSAQGRHIDAIGRLEHALTLLLADDAYALAIRCRILDDLGLAHRKVNDPSGARRNFEAALQARREAGLVNEVCQSLINLARLEVAEGELDTAAGYADDVITTLRGTPPSGLHANAEVLVAQVLLRQSRPDEGIPHAERALAVDRQIANRQGEAISLLVLAQCCREAGRRGEAEGHARACLALNQSMGDEGGAKKAQWLLDNLPA